MGNKIIDSHEIAAMSSSEVQTALNQGRLALLLSGIDIRKGQSLNTDQWSVLLKHVTAEQFDAAIREGLVPDYLLGEDPHPASEEPQPASADLGARGGTVPYKTRAWLKQATPAEVTEALRKGELDALLQGDLDHLP